MEKDKKKNDFDRIESLHNHFKKLEEINLEQVRNDVLDEKQQLHFMDYYNKRVIICNKYYNSQLGNVF